MNKELLIRAVRKCIKAELDSVHNYQNALNNSDDREVIEFFNERIAEEKRHYNFLIQYAKEITENTTLTDFSEELTLRNKESIFSDSFLRRIAEKQILFSAISTAVLLEKDSLQFYKNLAQDVDSPILRTFFNKMGTWETEHYLDVLNIQKQAEEYYWQINNFEPF